MEKEAEKYLSDRNIEKGDTLMAPKKSPGQAGTRATTVTTNLFGLDLEKSVTVFRYKVKISGIITRRDGSVSVTEITETTRHDFLNVDRRFLCRDVIKTYERRIQDKLKKDNNLLYYDLSRTLFSLKSLNVPENGGIEHFTIDEIVTTQTNVEFLRHFPSYSVVITPVTAGGGRLTVGDFAFVSNDVAKMDQSLAHFLNIATAQNVFDDNMGQFMYYSASSVYLMDPAIYGFTGNYSPTFDSNSSFLGIGMDKSVRVIEDGQKQNGDAKAALVVKMQKTPFHQVGSLLDKFEKVFSQWTLGPLNIGNLSHANRFFRGLYVNTVYPEDNPQARQRFPIYGFSPTCAKTEELMVDKQKLTVEQYYDRRYGIKLKSPTAPLVIRRERGMSTYYPIELLTVCDYQRVRANQLPPETTQPPLPPSYITALEQVGDGQIAENLEAQRSATLPGSSGQGRSEGVFGWAEKGELRTLSMEEGDVIFVKGRHGPTDRTEAGYGELWTWREEPASSAGPLSEMIEACAVPPMILRDQTTRLKDALNLNHSEHLRQMSIAFDDRPLEVGARILSPGDVQYQDKAERPDMGGRWLGGRYLLAAQINCWSAIALVDNSRDNIISIKKWTEFVNFYCQTMQRKGIRFQRPTRVEVLEIDSCNIRDKFKSLLNSGAEFVFIGHPKGHSGDAVHHAIKYHELDTEVITQGVLISTAIRMTSKPNTETMENIVNKTNIKMGGLNYALPFSNGMLADTLVIGFAVNHPAGGIGRDSARNNGNGTSSDTGGSTDVASDNGNGGNGHKAPKPPIEKKTPSVVGYSANIGERHNFEFIGDYKYQEARHDEKLHLIDQIVCRCLETYKLREKKYPASVVIYRNACGEGFYQHLLTYEIPLVKRLLADRCSAKLTMVVVNKLQNIRFTPSKINHKAEASDQNVQPGTVIDKGVVHPQWSEFYLASHRPLQGTARVPRYAILVDDNNFSMDKLQEFTFGLCFGHQIVSSPISLPAPVYIALEYAKRGRNNYNTDQHSANVFAKWHNYDGLVLEKWDNYDVPNNHFGFERKPYLSKWRVNA